MLNRKPFKARPPFKPKHRKLIKDYTPCRRNSEFLPIEDCEFYQWMVKDRPECRLIALREYKLKCVARAARWNAGVVFPKSVQPHHNILNLILDFYEINHVR